MDTARSGKRKVATVGTFDGLHRGHRRVIATVRELALTRGLEPTVICFDRHPLETIAPERAPRLIQSPSARTNTLFAEGITLLTLEFTRELASVSAAEWLRKMHEEHGVDILVVGYDNTFGCDGTGMSLADYRRLGAQVEIDVIEAPFEPRVSSSSIRHLIRDGNIPEANSLLGYSFTITGTVVEGKHLGTKLGFPTANIRPSYRALLPKEGVYAVDVLLPEGQWRKGVANIGRQPTVAVDAPVAFEVHIPGYNGNLYGRRLSVSFVSRLRDEQKFDSVDDLKRQIAKDIECTTGADINN